MYRDDKKVLVRKDEAGQWLTILPLCAPKDLLSVVSFKRFDTALSDARIMAWILEGRWRIIDRNKIAGR